MFCLCVIWSFPSSISKLFSRLSDTTKSMNTSAPIKNTAMNLTYAPCRNTSYAGHIVCSNDNVGGWCVGINLHLTLLAKVNNALYRGFSQT